MVSNSAAGVLEGIVVVDLTQMLAGPYCTMLLADHGADVIKVEPPHGDMSRAMGPFLAEDLEQQQGGYFHSINRNKRSIVLDLKTEAGKNKLRGLVSSADVLVENFRHGVMERMGLAYESLREVNPALVYCAIRGFGDARTGESPYVDRPAFDIVAQAMGGFMSMTGPPELPTKAGAGIGDIVPGIMAAFGIVAGVRYAEINGKGQFLDVAMYDAMLAISERIVYRYSFTGDISHGEGNEHPLVCPFSVYASRDGWMAIGCPLDQQWNDLLTAMNMEHLKADSRFLDNRSRVANAQEVRKIITEWTSQYTKRELSEILGGKVPAGPVNDVVDIVEDSHVKKRNMLSPLELGGLVEQPYVAGVPVHFAETPGAVRSAGPRLGEHNEEVFREFGIG